MTDTEILAGLSDVQALACTMMGEAAGDSKDGSSVEERIAVACAIRNRVREPKKFGNSFKAVCLQPWQFSCWNKSDPNRPKLLALAYLMVTNQPLMDPVAEETLYLADGVRTGILLDRVKGANHYLTRALFAAAPPTWAKGKVPVAQVGSHLFFKL